MKKIKEETFTLIFYPILIINMLLIFSGVFSYFFNIKDYTLIAGIIAFFGAVLGGIITLFGVKRTLLDGRRKDRVNKLPKLINAIEEERQYILELQIEINSYEINSSKEEYAEYLYRINGELIERVRVNEIISLGEELYSLYKNIIKGTFDLYIKYKDLPFPETARSVKSTDDLSELCLSFHTLSTKDIKELTEEYFRLE